METYIFLGKCKEKSTMIIKNFHLQTKHSIIEVETKLCLFCQNNSKSGLISLTYHHFSRTKTNVSTNNLNTKYTNLVYIFKLIMYIILLIISNYYWWHLLSDLYIQQLFNYNCLIKWIICIYRIAQLKW